MSLYKSKKLGFIVLNHLILFRLKKRELAAATLTPSSSLLATGKSDDSLHLSLALIHHSIVFMVSFCENNDRCFCFIVLIHVSALWICWVFDWTSLVDHMRHLQDQISSISLFVLKAYEIMFTESICLLSCTDITCFLCFI